MEPAAAGERSSQPRDNEHGGSVSDARSSKCQRIAVTQPTKAGEDSGVARLSCRAKSAELVGWQAPSASAMSAAKLCTTPDQAGRASLRLQAATNGLKQNSVRHEADPNRHTSWVID